MRTGLFLALAAAVLLPPWRGVWTWGVPAAAAMLYWLISGAELLPALRRSAVALPFALLLVAANSLSGLPAAAPREALYRSCAVILMTALFFSSTPFAELTAFLRRLRAPAVFVSVFTFMYRYFFCLREDVLSKLKALRARSPRRPGRKELAALSTALLLRSFARAGRVKMAMTARGWEA